MKKIVVATKNRGKAREFADMLEPFGYQVQTLLDYPDLPDIVEDGDSFQENAAIKASQAAKMLALPTISDDSGLSVDALDGRPGIYSARYAGPQKSDADNRAKLLKEMQNVPDEDRTATFHCVIVVSDSKGQIQASYEGLMDGYIAREEQGSNGFGYDSIFYHPDKKQTSAEMTEEEKNAISHRGKAMRSLLADLKAGHFDSLS